MIIFGVSFFFFYECGICWFLQYTCYAVVKKFSVLEIDRWRGSQKGVTDHLCTFSRIDVIINHFTFIYGFILWECLDGLFDFYFGFLLWFVTVSSLRWFSENLGILTFNHVGVTFSNKTVTTDFTFNMYEIAGLEGEDSVCESSECTEKVWISQRRFWEKVPSWTSGPRHLRQSVVVSRRLRKHQSESTSLDVTTSSRENSRRRVWSTDLLRLQNLGPANSE